MIKTSDGLSERGGVHVPQNVAPKSVKSFLVVRVSVNKGNENLDAF